MHAGLHVDVKLRFPWGMSRDMSYDVSGMATARLLESFGSIPEFRLRVS